MSMVTPPPATSTTATSSPTGTRISGTEPGAEHHAGVAGGQAVGHRVGDRTAECDRSDGGAVGRPRAGHTTQVIVAGRSDHCAGDHGRHERPGQATTQGEFFDDDDRFVDPVAGSADVLGKVQAEPTELRDSGPNSGSTSSDD